MSMSSLILASSENLWASHSGSPRLVCVCGWQRKNVIVWKHVKFEIWNLVKANSYLSWLISAIRLTQPESLKSQVRDWSDQIGLWPCWWAIALIDDVGRLTSQWVALSLHKCSWDVQKVYLNMSQGLSQSARMWMVFLHSCCRIFCLSCCPDILC